MANPHSSAAGSTKPHGFSFGRHKDLIIFVGIVIAIAFAAWPMVSAKYAAYRVQQDDKAIKAVLNTAIANTTKLDPALSTIEPVAPEDVAKTVATLYNPEFWTKVVEPRQAPSSGYDQHFFIVQPPEPQGSPFRVRTLYIVYKKDGKGPWTAYPNQ